MFPVNLGMCWSCHWFNMLPGGFRVSHVLSVFPPSWLILEVPHLCMGQNGSILWRKLMGTFSVSLGEKSVVCRSFLCLGSREVGAMPNKARSREMKRDCEMG